MTLYPVLISVPHAENELSAERMKKQRDYARRALRHCAKLSGAPLDDWSQQKGGAPIPNGEFYWSISHTRGLAAAVIAKQPVGIDVERIRERRRDLFDEVGRDEEWSLLGGRTWPAFFQLWTAKEAVLKANSLGIGHLDQCRLMEQNNSSRFVVPPDLALPDSLSPEPQASACADIRSQGRHEPTKNDTPAYDSAKLDFRNTTWTVHHRHPNPDYIAALATVERFPIEWIRLT